jgi:alkylation response protein AidB-like acyl-CoA dehydrogenase
MDFGITPENEDIVEKARIYAKEILHKRAEKYDREGLFPRENFEDLSKVGFTSLTLPKKYGGRDLYSDPATYAIVLYELSKACTNTAMLFHMHSSITHVITFLGTEDQSEFYSKEVKKGKIFASWASENTSSLHGQMVMDTKAKLNEDHYLVNGRKYFCSMAGEADYYVLWCQLEDEEDLSKSIVLLIAPSSTPGFIIEDNWNTSAMRGTMSHSMEYNNIKIPLENLIGNPGDAIRPDVLPKFGFGYSAVYLGTGGGAFDWVIDYAKKRKLKPDNIPISNFPNIQIRIGEMKVQLESALLMVQRAGWLIGTNGAENAYGAINEAKHIAAKTAAMITENAMQIAGAPSLLRNYPLERYHREARAGLVMPPNIEKSLELSAKAFVEGSAGSLMT